MSPKTDVTAKSDTDDELPPGVLQVGPKSISDFKIWVAEKFIGGMNDDRAE